MQNIDSKTCASRSITRDLAKLIRGGEVKRSAILDMYKVLKLAWGDSDSQNLDPGSKTLKSLHTILQIGVMFRVRDKVAVFCRPSKEKDDVTKVTGSFSVLKSWSPKSFNEEDLANDLARKVHLDAGPALKWRERGIAISDIFESQKPFAPHYLFLIYEIELEDEERLRTKAHSNPGKHTEYLAPWVNPQQYHANSFQVRFFAPTEGRNVTMEFDGAVDQLVLKSLKRGDMVDLEGTTRGRECYFPSTNLVCDTDKFHFSTGEVEFDEQMENLLRVIKAIREEKGTPDMDVTLGDIINFKPKLYGFEIDGVALIRWLKQRCKRADLSGSEG